MTVQSRSLQQSGAAAINGVHSLGRIGIAMLIWGEWSRIGSHSQHETTGAVEQFELNMQSLREHLVSKVEDAAGDLEFVIYAGTLWATRAAPGNAKRHFTVSLGYRSRKPACLSSCVAATRLTLS